MLNKGTVDEYMYDHSYATVHNQFVVFIGNEASLW